AGRVALRHCRARAARPDGGGAGPASRVEEPQPEPGLCRRQPDPALRRQEPDRARAHPRRPAQGGARIATPGLSAPLLSLVSLRQLPRRARLALADQRAAVWVPAVVDYEALECGVVRRQVGKAGWVYDHRGHRNIWLSRIGAETACRIRETE